MDGKGPSGGLVILHNAVWQRGSCYALYDILNFMEFYCIIYAI